MGGSAKGSSSNQYIPIQHPNPNRSYVQYTSSAAIDPQPQDYADAASYPPQTPFTLDEIHEAEDLITRLSNK